MGGVLGADRSAFPDYVPTYLMAGGTLVALGRKDEAIDDFRKGIEVATDVAAISMLAASSSRPWPSSLPS